VKKVIAMTIFGLFMALAACWLARRSEARVQSRSAGTPTLDQILDKYVEALGGRAALEKLTSRVTVQTVTRRGQEEQMEIYGKAPNQRLIVTTLADGRKILRGFDGATGWESSADGDLQILKDESLAHLRESAEFYRELKLKELHPQMTLKGKETIEGRTAYLVETAAATGRGEQLYFDAQTGLLIRQTQQTVAFIRQSDAEAPQAKVIEIVFDYDDYRLVDGMRLPFLIRQKMPPFVTTIKVKEIRHNLPLDDTKFKPLAIAAAAKPDLPAPTGAHRAGRTSFHWVDETRPETFTDDPTDRRELMVHLWYPAEAPSDAKPAPYCIGYEAVKAGLNQMEQQVCETLTTHTYAHAKLAPGQTVYPVLLFSIGNEMAASLYTLLFEELASHGYVVAAIDHPYEAKAVVYPNGRVAQYNESKRPTEHSPTFPKEFADFYRLRTDERAADASFVLTQLEKLNAQGEFEGRLDLNRVGIFGHSIGGVAAAQACRLDARFKAGLNLDGLVMSRPFYASAQGKALSQPFMFMGKIPAEPTAEELAKRYKVTRQQWNENQVRLQKQVADVMAAREGRGYLVWFKDATHDSFSDVPLIAPQLSAGARAANLPRAKLIRAYTLAFFEQHLRAKPAALLSAQPAPEPQVKVEVFTR
jgi:predicted dienelactone hydrolase